TGNNVFLGDFLAQVLHGPVSVTSTGGRTGLYVEDQDDMNPVHVTVTDSAITGLAPTTISYDPASLRELHVDGGSGANTYDIPSTPPAPADGSTGSGSDVVNVTSSAGPLTIDVAGPGTVNVEAIGGPATVNLAAAGTVNVTPSAEDLVHLRGSLAVYGSHSGTLNLDDQNDPAPFTPLLGSSFSYQVSPSNVSATAEVFTLDRLGQGTLSTA